jgi:tRNA (cytidine/uridine-2'-O-)-methyltransferase
LINIVLVEPEIPPNTGNIARTCAATGSALHLIKPLGFQIDDTQVKRAGLDYWKHVNLSVYESLDEFMGLFKEEKLFYATTKGKIRYTDVAYEDNCFILFGKETKGLPESLIKANPSSSIRIPMGKDESLRSLNLSNSVNIVLYEALRQLNFPNLY